LSLEPSISRALSTTLEIGELEETADLDEQLSPICILPYFTALCLVGKGWPGS
jgi:hypothetical protein